MIKVIFFFFPFPVLIYSRQSAVRDRKRGDCHFFQTAVTENSKVTPSGMKQTSGQRVRTGGQF